MTKLLPGEANEGENPKLRLCSAELLAKPKSDIKLLVFSIKLVFDIKQNVGHWPLPAPQHQPHLGRTLALTKIFRRK